MSKKVYIALGSNLGKKVQNLDQACDMITSKIGKILKRSGNYMTEPWGFESEDEFVNGTIVIDTELSASELLKKLKEIEALMGRRKRSGEGYESRIIDLDILDYNGEIIDETDLKIPHPGIELRNFVLVPLTELDSGWRHPKTGKTGAEMLEELNDTSKVVRTS